MDKMKVFTQIWSKPRSRFYCQQHRSQPVAPPWWLSCEMASRALVSWSSTVSSLLLAEGVLHYK